MISADAPRKAGRPARPLQREQLLAIAREAFAELGYAGASMGEIAARTGIRKSSLFHHFPTKDELYRESLAATVNDIGALIAQSSASGLPLLERIEKSTRELQLYLGRNRTAARLLLREFIDATAAVPAAGELVHAVLQGIVADIEGGMASGILPRGNARHLALSLVGIHFTFFATPTVSGRMLEAEVFDPDIVEKRAEAVVEHVQRLLGIKR